MRRLTVAGAALAFTASACGQTEPGGPAAQAERVQAVATVFPLAWMAEQVAPDAEMTFLGQRGQEPHDLELSPGDRAAIETSDVVLYMGDIGFQPQVEEAVPASGGEVVSVSDIVGEEALLTGEAHEHEGEGETSGAEAPGQEGEPSEGEAHGQGSEAAEGGAADPHVWFDPELMAMVAERVGAAFATADPDDAEAYERNAARLVDQLTALDDEIQRMLSDCRFDEAIVSHEAYAYLLAPHGLRQHGVAGASPESGASPGELAELTQMIRAEGIPAVLAEPVEGRADAEALAQEAGVQLLEINPLEVVTEEEYKTGYIELLRQQAQTFATALQCAGAS